MASFRNRTTGFASPRRERWFPAPLPPPLNPLISIKFISLRALANFPRLFRGLPDLLIVIPYLEMPLLRLSGLRRARYLCGAKFEYDSAMVSLAGAVNRSRELGQGTPERCFLPRSIATGSGGSGQRRQLICPGDGQPCVRQQTAGGESRRLTAVEDHADEFR